MRQNGLTIAARIKQGATHDLDDLLSRIGKDLKHNRLIRFSRMRRLHFASWIILNNDPAYDPCLILETSYDGDLEDHLDQLIEHGREALDQIYCFCEGYPSGGSMDPLQIKIYLKERAVPSKVFFPAFPGMTLASIRNAIATRKMKERVLAKLGRQVPLEALSEAQIQAILVRHFMRHALTAPVLSDPTRKQLRHRVILSAILLALPALVCLPFAAIFLLIERLHEIRERGIPKPPDKPVDDRIFSDPLCAQNHLTTLVNIKSGRGPLLKIMLGLYWLLGKTVFLLGSIGSIRSLHFARWLLLDNGKRLLFLSNHDGSWSAYLGDFADQGWGVSSIWGHTEGFPPAKWVFWGGCKNIDAYAKWSRQHNLYAQVWYSAYPNATILNLQRDIAFRDKLAEAIHQAQLNRAGSQKVAQPIDRADLQAIVASGFNHLNFSRYLMFKIIDRAQAKVWLRAIAGHITHARLRESHEPKPARAVNIAFSAGGLDELGLGQQAITGFPREFSLGITRPEAPGILGDTGPNAAKNWQFGGPCNEPVHIVLLLYANCAEELEGLTNLLNADQSHGLIEIFGQNSVRHDMFEPFGFRDGISQPLVHGLNATTQDNHQLVKAGEFILGYENEYDEISSLPRISAELDPNGILPPALTDPAYRDLGRNGSYLVIRKLAQHVNAFQNFLDDRSKGANGSVNPHERELLAARMLGRWRSGAPLVMFPGRDQPAAGADKLLNNNFTYLPVDPKGYSCPLGSHIRRSNPRDSLAGLAPQKSQKVVNRHRIIRRGRIYREPEPALERDLSAPPDQGLFFVAINADIRRQFEFLQQTWINNGTFSGLYQDRDPLMSNQGGDNMFTRQGCPVDQSIRGLPNFVTVKGGGYFFLPGIKTLTFLAS